MSEPLITKLQVTELVGSLLYALRKLASDSGADPGSLASALDGVADVIEELAGALRDVAGEFEMLSEIAAPEARE